MPWWYPTLKAARYLGVPPWELLDDVQIPRWLWLEWGLMAAAAEASAEAQIEKRNRA